MCSVYGAEGASLTGKSISSLPLAQHMLHKNVDASNLSWNFTHSVASVCVVFPYK